MHPLHGRLEITITVYYDEGADCENIVAALTPDEIAELNKEYPGWQPGNSRWAEPSQEVALDEGRDWYKVGLAATREAINAALRR